MTGNFDEKTKEYLSLIENYLDSSCFRYENQPQTVLFDAMRYSLLAGGKRLRPIFVLDFCRMCGGNNLKAMPFAAAVEMVHTYSLIHDDLPCMDNDDLRRGKPTNHKVYGEGIATLAGDALLTASFHYIAQADLPAQVRIDAVDTLSRCAGDLGMVGGQVLDISSETRQCTAREVVDIQSRKTGALIEAACVMGVLAGGGSKEQIENAKIFASNLGLAFQIRDDMLDVIGSKENMGKSVGTDQVKNTFVHLYGVEKCNELVKNHTKLALDALSAFDDNEYMSALASSLTDRIN